MNAPTLVELQQPHTALAEHADSIRRQVVEMCCGPEGGHLGGSLSIVDILTVLYFDVLANVADGPGHPERDVLLLSKGHGAIALYATLAERGYFPASELETFGRAGGRLMGHPVRALPGVELPTGSLGHGLGLGVGFAMAAQLQSSRRRVFVLLGDGELQEGSCWESAAVAASQRLDRLVAIVDRNGLQLTGPTEDVVDMEPLAERWRSFGWAVREVDGHDQAALARALHALPWTDGRPGVLIARTHKGYGVPKLADQTQSHCVALSDRQQQRIRASLSAFLSGAQR
jgi:transketolase